MATLKIVTFASVHQALRAEKVLREQGIPISVINTPREVSSDCGISLSFAEMLEPRVIKALQARAVQYRGVYSL